MHPRRALFSLLLCLWLIPHHSYGQPKAALGLQISQPVASPTRPGQPNAAVFLEIGNPATTADRLIGFSPTRDVADRGELHTMRHEQGVMIMREVPGFDIPAGASLKLAPGGNHLMLIGIKRALKDGEEFSGVLRFERAGEVQINIKVGSPNAGGAKHQGSSHRH